MLSRGAWIREGEALPIQVQCECRLDMARLHAARADITLTKQRMLRAMTSMQLASTDMLHVIRQQPSDDDVMHDMFATRYHAGE